VKRVVDMRKGCPNCHKNDFTEFINGGIKQEVHYNGGYIVSEVTTYTKDFPDSYAICNGCGTRYEYYNL
jgi:hypothetical protein